MTRVFSLAVVLVTLSVGCNGGEVDEGGLTVGVLMPVTGSFAFGFQAETGAMDVARNEINAAGGVLGEPLRFDVADSTSGEDEAAIQAAMTGFAVRGVEAVLGGGSSGTTAVAIPVAVENETLLVSGVAASPLLTDEADLFFRTIMTVGDMGEATAAYLDSESVTSVAMVRLEEDALYGFLASVIEPDLESRGISVPFNETYAHTSGQSFDPSAVLTMLYDEKPDALWVGGYAEDATRFLQALDRTRFTGRIVGGTGFQQQLLDNVGASKMEGVDVITSFQPAGPDFDRFRAAYQNANNGLDVDFYAIAQAAWYDATAVLGLAIAAAGTYDALAIRNQLRVVGSPPGEVIEAGQLARGLDLIARGMPVNYEGMASSVDFDEDGEVEIAYGLWRFSGGTFSYSRPLLEGVDF